MSTRTTSGSERSSCRWVRRGAWVSTALFVFLSGCFGANVRRGITEVNVGQQIAAARTAADHEALAMYFRDRAAAEAARQADHYQAIIDSYKEATTERSASPAEMRIREWMRAHCRALIESYRRVQERYLDLAADHARMATELAGEE